MKNVRGNIRKAIIFALAATLIAISIFMLVSCNRNKNNVDNSKLRQESVMRVRNAFITSLGKGWAADLSDEQIGKLDDAGDYIVASGFADMIADIFNRSSLLTGKLKVLADALESDDGKALLADFAKNIERIVPVFDMVDFTRDDVSELFYMLLTTLVSDSGNTMSAILTRLQNIRTQKGVSVAASDSLSNAISSVSQAKSALVPTGTEKQELLNALSDAEDAITNLISFVYNVSDAAFTDEMLENLLSGSGALSDITDAELSTIVNALSQNILDLKDALSDSEISKLDKAIGLLIDNFDKEVVPTALYSQLYAQVVQYAKYANMVVGIIPPLCDMAYVASDLFKQVEFISQFRDVVAGSGSSDSDGIMASINTSIFASKIIVNLMDNFSRDKFVFILDNIREQGSKDYQKVLPSLILDVILNLSVNIGKDDESMLLPVHPQIFSESDVTKVVGLIGFHLNIGTFKQRYYEYCNSSEVDRSKALYRLDEAARRCNFDDLGAENQYSIAVQTDKEMVDRWYNYYAVTGVNKVKQTSEYINDKVHDDLVAFIDEYYLQSKRDVIVNLANTPLLTEEPDPEEQESYAKLIIDGGVGGFITLFSLLFQLIS